MVRQIKNKFRTKSKANIKPIDSVMVKAIRRVQMELQRKEHIEFGGRSQVVTFQFASMVLGRRFLK